MSSEEYDIWGMPVRPSAPPAAEEQSSAPQESEPAPEPVVEAATVEAAAEVAPVVESAPAKPVTVSEAEIAAALVAVNAVAAKSSEERKAKEVVAEDENPATMPVPAAPVEEIKAEEVAAVVEAPVVAAPAEHTPVPPTVVTQRPRVEPVAPPVVEPIVEPVVTSVEPVAAMPVESTFETPVVAVAAPVATPVNAPPVAETAAAVEAKPTDPVARESSVAPAVVTAAVVTDAASTPIDVWGDGAKSPAAAVTTAVVAGAVAGEVAKAAEEPPKPIANPLRRKNASRSSNSPVAPTPSQYVATPGAAPASTLSTGSAPDPRYAITGTAVAAGAASPYALTPSAASVSATPVAASLSTPVTTPIPPASTPMATTPGEPVPVYSTTSMETPVVAPFVAAPLATPVTAVVPPGSMPVMVPTAVAAAAVLSSAGIQVNRVETYAPPTAPRPIRQAAEAKIEVINPEGWHRDFPLTKTILYVGSAPGADIVLPSSEVAPRHLQFVPSTANKIGYRLINLGATPVAVMGAAGGEPRIAAPRASLEVGDGDRVELGGYGLVFHGGEVTSQQIQARLEVPNPRLSLEKPLDGALYIRNGGEKAGVQFLVEVQGIDSRFVQVEPGPVLFPGMEKRVAFRISHPQTANPSAGDQPINFVVTAPEGYPGETAIASQVITVAPFFAHRVRLIAIEPEMSGFSLSSGR